LWETCLSVLLWGVFIPTCRVRVECLLLALAGAFQHQACQGPRSILHQAVSLCVLLCGSLRSNVSVLQYSRVTSTLDVQACTCGPPACGHTEVLALKCNSRTYGRQRCSTAAHGRDGFSSTTGTAGIWLLLRKHDFHHHD
jgi:hypothetical protein